MADNYAVLDGNGDPLTKGAKDIGSGVQADYAYTRDGDNLSLGAKADTAATTDTGTFSLIALFKRLLAKLTAGIKVELFQSTAPTYSQLVAPAYFADANTISAATLDLSQKRGAWLYAFIGRQAASALTRSAYVAVRKTVNGATNVRFPAAGYDRVSATAAVGATTLNGATAAGDLTAVLTSATTFAVGDVVCFSSPDTAGNRIEFAKIRSISSNTLSFERPLLIAHNNADRVTSAADVFDAVWLPGGDIYSVFVVNSSGQAVVAEVEVETLP